MTVKLQFVAHAATSATTRMAFPAGESLARPELLEGFGIRALTAVCGPEPANVQTSKGLGLQPRVTTELADLQAGTWAGQAWEDLPLELLGPFLAGETPAPQGESLPDVVARVGSWLGEQQWGEGRTVVVASAMVVRASLVALLEMPMTLFHRLDVGPLTTAVLSGKNGRWNLQSLGPLSAGRLSSAR
ncbi:hypothetical protein EH165_13490 [Nakamurella antarctica]|uniref:Broad specificity phosphatase PhoE n=1 Tax=Nakamurella antarctica TaxID=1902245 RepID=A0A3G8ZNY4_9ACTN|nr:histidine phosphatase family protein [Nakamurella antarctica]AZI59009.1 hypothetical protein EH165_13490 [Nakamurella antarctica]